MLTEIINDNYENLSATEIIVLQYIINNLIEVSNMHIDTLAKHCSVSRTSIYRLTRKLNFSGYSEFKNYIRWTNSGDGAPKETNQFRHIKEDADRTFNNSETSISVKNVINTIHDSDNVFVFGTGQAQYYCAQEFQRVFSQIGKFTYVIKALDELELVAKSFSENTVLVVISLSGDTKNLLTVLNQCKINKTTIVSLTNFSDNSLAHASQHNLYANTRPMNIGSNISHYSFAPFYMVIDYIFVSYYYEFKNK